MKKIILIAMLAIAALSSRQTLMAQITLEHTYDSASSISLGWGGQLMIINFEVEGKKYVRSSPLNNSITIYNLDHSIYKSFIIPGTPIGYQLMYFSEHLFNTDDKIEYMVIEEPSNGTFTTSIYNEDGVQLFHKPNQAPVVTGQFPDEQVPIYNTLNGTKMILSGDVTDITNYATYVYSLPGTLSNSIKQINNSNNNQLSMENIYPNPSNGNNTTIEFYLPQGVNSGVVVVYNLQGMELKRYQVDNTFHSLIIQNSDLHSGTYFYQLLTSIGTTGAKKMIVVK